MMKTTWIAILLMGLFAAPAVAGEDKTAEVKIPKQMEKYVTTDTVKHCISLTRIRQSKVWDDNHILFKMRNGDFWLNALPHRCPRLGFEESFMYRTSQNRLCNLDIITVLDTSSRMNGPSCGLGKFQKLEKKPKDKG